MDAQCRECLAKLSPENPRQPFYTHGRYLKPICYYCGNYEPEKEPEQPQQVEHIHFQSSLSRKEHDVLIQTALSVQHLDRRLKEHLSRRKKSRY